MKNVSAIKSETQKARVSRPDGVDLTRYKGLKNWSYRRWAWEFLRRNEEFIEACGRVEHATDDEKQIVADTFGLSKFKSFKDKYRAQKNKTIFSTDEIGSWSNLNKDINRKLKPIKIQPGQVLIRFDLASAIVDKKALEKQLQLAEKRLRQRLISYASELKITPASHNHKIVTFGIYLRILDLLADKKTDIECAQAIFPKETQGKDSNEVRFHVKNRKTQALSYANIKYRFLALLEGKPKGKEVSLGETSDISPSTTGK